MDDLFIRRISIEHDKIEKDSHLRNIPALWNAASIEIRKPVTLFAGENGTGKSTLLEAAAVVYGFNQEGGTLNFRFSTYNDVSPLYEAVRLSKGYQRAKAGYFFRAESFFNVATKTEEYRNSDIWVKPKEVYYQQYGGRAFHEQSHGESFLAYFTAFDRPGVYLLDEPEASLSPQSQLALLLQIVRMSRSGSQFLIVTHSPILLGIPDAEILSFDDGVIHPCCYEETSSVQMYRLFMDTKETLIKQLLADKE